MDVITSDCSRTVNLGTSGYIEAVRATAIFHTKGIARSVQLALEFFQDYTCASDKALETARQINLVRDALSQVPPQKALRNLMEPESSFVSADELSPVTTSCANLFTTADGKDYFYELVVILTYAGYAGKTVQPA